MSDENNLQNNDETEEIDEISPTGEDGEFSFEDASGEFQAKVKKLQLRLKDLIKEKEEYLSGWQRCRADFVNAKKNEERDRTGLIDSVGEMIVSDLLPVLDSFDLAIQDGSKMEGVPEAWRTGFTGIYSKLLEALGRRGLKYIGNVGDKFDLNEHQPIALMDVDRAEMDDVVTEVLQKGYKVNSRVIRPAKVKIGHHKAQI